MPGVLGLSTAWACPEASQISAKAWCSPPWSGLLCTDAPANNIVEINLNSLGLGGSIPFSIGMMSTLKYLYLQTNNIGGTIPPSLGNLTSLLTLRLESNSLEGTVPNSLTKLSKLKVLNVNDNYLTGTLPSGFSADIFNDDGEGSKTSFNELTHIPSLSPTLKPSKVYLFLWLYSASFFTDYLIPICSILASQPSSQPSRRATENPSESPSAEPSLNPTANPTSSPTCNPTTNPTSNPTTNPTSNPTMSPSGERNPDKNAPSLKPQPTSKPSVAPSPAFSASPSYSVSPTCSPSSYSPTVSFEPTSMPSTSPPTISFPPTFEPTFEPSAEPSAPELPFPPANITSLLRSNPRKFSFEAGPLAGFVIGCVVFGGLLMLLFYYCIMPSIGITGVGKNTVAPSNQPEKNILIWSKRF